MTRSILVVLIILWYPVLAGAQTTTELNEWLINSRDVRPSIPVVVSPAPGAVDVPVTTAQVVIKAVGSIECDIYMGANTTNPPLVKTLKPCTAYDIPAGSLLPHTKYTVRVRGRNTAGTRDMPASYPTFTTAATTAPACTYAIEPTAVSVPVTGGTVSTQVKTAAGCAWTATSDQPWLVLGETSGKGPAAVTATALANTGPARQGRLTIQGQILTVSQSTDAPVSPVAKGVQVSIDPATIAAGQPAQLQVLTPEAADPPFLTVAANGLNVPKTGQGGGSFVWRLTLTPAETTTYQTTATTTGGAAFSGMPAAAVTVTPACTTPVDCVWGPYEGPWLVWSDTCVGVTRTIVERQSREVLTPASCGGAACAGLPYQERTRTEPCSDPGAGTQAILAPSDLVFKGFYRFPNPPALWYSRSGLAMRMVNGQLRLFTLDDASETSTPNGLLEFAIPTAAPTLDYKIAPMVTLVKNWGSVYAGRMQTHGGVTGNTSYSSGLFYDRHAMRCGSPMAKATCRKGMIRRLLSRS